MTPGARPRGSGRGRPVSRRRPDPGRTHSLRCRPPTQLCLARLGLRISARPADLSASMARSGLHCRRRRRRQNSSRKTFRRARRRAPAALLPALPATSGGGAKRLNPWARPGHAPRVRPRPSPPTTGSVTARSPFRCAVTTKAPSSASFPGPNLQDSTAFYTARLKGTWRPFHKWGE